MTFVCQIDKTPIFPCQKLLYSLNKAIAPYSDHETTYNTTLDSIFIGSEAYQVLKPNST